MSTFSPLQIGSTPSCSTVTLQIPAERLTIQLLEEFDELLYTVEDDYPNSLLLLRGEENFCQGLDYAQFCVESDGGPRHLQRAEQVLHHLDKLSNPKIAILEGKSLGFGATLSLCCDCTLAQEQATLVWDEISQGITPGMATWMLPKYIGLGRARELLLSGRDIGVQEAYSWGLITRIFSDNDQLRQKIEAASALLTAASPVALNATRKLLRESWGASYENALGPCLASQAMCLHQLGK